jgi:hypothetical protein
MNWSKVKTYLPCPSCERNMPTIIKMGGLICEACRIVAPAYSKEWKEAMDRYRQQEAAQDGQQDEE